MLEKPISRTKILATIGPACGSLAKVKSMIQAGVTAFRLNMSHGDDDTRQKYISYIKTARAELKRSVAILVDLRGPRIRLGKFSGTRNLVKGDMITLKVAKSTASDEILPV
ncbi:MAG: pyruvate kinase, partial [Planctomycetota bacterium]|nr:pyruvate kinase [Planctomycetota bacterium]